MFVREFDGHKIVNITPVFTSEVCRNALLYGNPTIKFDGAACAIFDGKLYKRFDLGKAKKGAPQGRRLIMCESQPDPQTGHWPAWLECRRDDNADKWFFEAFDRWFADWKPEQGPMQGTYEAIGPHFQGNPYNLEFDGLVRHGAVSVADLFPNTDAQRLRELENGELGTRRYARTFEGVKQFLEDSVCEGLVFWDSHKPLCKIKRSDFGLPWNVKGGRK